MMKNIKNSYILVLLLSLYGCKSCKKDPDPCTALKPVNANFTMTEASWNGFEQENYWDKYSYNYCDTSCKTVVNFKADIENANEYTWLVGSGIYTGQSMSLNFDDGISTGLKKFPITLIVKKSPNLACFPSDDGRDTLTKTLVMNFKPLVFGKFRGSWQGSSEVFTIEIKQREVETPIYLQYIIVNNYNAKGDSVGTADINTYAFKYKKAIIDNYFDGRYTTIYPPYDNVRVKGELDMLSQNKVVFTYSYDSVKGDFTAPRIQRKFIGYRVL